MRSGAVSSHSIPLARLPCAEEPAANPVDLFQQGCPVTEEGLGLAGACLAVVRGLTRAASHPFACAQLEHYPRPRPGPTGVIGTAGPPGRPVLCAGVDGGAGVCGLATGVTGGISSSGEPPLTRGAATGEDEDVE